MLKLKNLLVEAEPKAGKFSEEEVGTALEKAFKAGPVATREFLNSPMGQDAALNGLLQKPDVTTDGDAVDDKIKVSGPSDISVNPEKMVPTQNFIDAMKSVAFPLGSAKALSSAITSKKGFGTIVTSGNTSCNRLPILWNLSIAYISFSFNKLAKVFDLK